ncbi:MAG: hypothetical protein ACOCVI_02060 [Planctomycetota bacterium]
MKSNLNTPILLLTISAIVLSVLVFSLNTPDQAQAVGDTVRRGRWLMSVGQFDRNADLVYVVDLKARILSVYAASERNKRLGRITSAKLDNIFGKAR